MSSMQAKKITSKNLSQTQDTLQPLAHQFLSFPTFDNAHTTSLLINFTFPRIQILHKAMIRAENNMFPMPAKLDPARLEN